MALTNMGFPLEYATQAATQIPDPQVHNAVERCLLWMEKHPLPTASIEEENRAKMIESMIGMGFERSVIATLLPGGLLAC